MTFTDLSPLWLGAPLVALILVGVWSHGTRRRKLAAFLGGRRALVRLARTDLSGLRLGRVLLLGLAGACLAFAAADPHWVEPPPGEAPPVDRVVLAIDVSASMQATDVAPTRLASAVEIATELLDALEGQQVGLMLFAGTAYPIALPTLDHTAVAFLLRGVVPTMASAYDPGTLLSVAVADGITMLQAVDSASVPARIGRRRLVVIGDGDVGDEPAALGEAAALAAEAGVEVHTIGVGTERGGPMSLPAGTYQLGGPVTDAGGRQAVSRMRESLLRDLAGGAGGLYAHVDAEGDVRAIMRALVAPAPVAEVAPGDTPPPWARYDLPLTLGVAALILILMESLLDASLPRLGAYRREVA
ncbi:MAG: VWA domain-containing protein [Gemmatimonadales bacterium]